MNKKELENFMKYEIPENIKYISELTDDEKQFLSKLLYMKKQNCELALKLKSNKTIVENAHKILNLINNIFSKLNLPEIKIKQKNKKLKKYKNGTRKNKKRNFNF